MADTQKPAEVVAETPAVAEPVVEAAPAVEATPAVEEAKKEEAPVAAAEEPKAEEAAAAAPAEEAKKEEVKPVEAGHLEHKASPASFPKNIIYSKQHFFFGTDALATDKLASYLKNEKATEVGHHVAAWAAETGKGLLFFAKDSDKSTPVGAIQLAESSEPAVEGANKFHFTAKGHKHTFKASSTAERDNWVAQLKLKIAEAKELATTVVESETYKKTIADLKPAPAPKKEEAPAAEPAAETAAAETTEAPKVEEPVAEEPAKEEAPKEEKKDEPKRRSASRKRASIFGSLLGKKEEKKEVAKEETPAPVATDEAPAAAEEIKKEETPAAEPVAETPAVADAATETPAAEPAATEEPKKEEPVKPAPSKRSSIFGSFLSKKKAEPEAAPVSPAKETPAAEAPVAETAPVIPAVETSEPLSTEVAPAAAAPAETTEATPAAEEPKKEVRSEKRKSSIPFLGKKDKAVSSDEEGEKPKSGGFSFSKLRNTVKGKGKAAEKPTEKPAEEKPIEEAAVEEPKKEEEAPVAVEEPKKEETPAAPAAEETPIVEKPAAAATPVVAATA